jgi:hypothetical protein
LIEEEGDRPSLGYDQELTLIFTKHVKNEAEAKKFKAEVTEHINKTLEPDTQKTQFDSGVASVSMTAVGTCLYDNDLVAGGGDDDDDVLLGSENISAKRLTRELGCRLEIMYQGEDPDDKDERAYENGRLVTKFESFRIDTMNNEVKEFNRIMDGIEKKGLTVEAQELRDSRGQTPESQPVRPSPSCQKTSASSPGGPPPSGPPALRRSRRRQEAQSGLLSARASDSRGPSA